jgi:hypothetical protein
LACGDFLVPRPEAECGTPGGNNNPPAPSPLSPKMGTPHPLLEYRVPAWSDNLSFSLPLVSAATAEAPAPTRSSPAPQPGYPAAAFPAPPAGGIALSPALAACRSRHPSPPTAASPVNPKERPGTHGSRAPGLEQPIRFQGNPRVRRKPRAVSKMHWVFHFIFICASPLRAPRPWWLGTWAPCRTCRESVARSAARAARALVSQVKHRR